MSTHQPDSNATAEDRHADLPGAIGAVVFAVIGGYVLWASMSMSANAAAFPRAIGALLLGLSLVQLWRSVTGRSSTEQEEGISLADQRVGLGRRIALVATMLGWAVLFPVIGFLTTSFLAALALTRTAQFGRLTPVRAIVYLLCLVAMVAGFYLLMVRVLNIPLPRALFF